MITKQICSPNKTIMIKKILAIALAAIAFVACTAKKNSEEQDEKKAKILVLYYSQTGATKTVAEEIQKQLSADIEAIEPEVPYDGDFNQTIERGQKEMQDGSFPALKPIKANINDYDVIFLGFPIWFGTYANPIASLVKSVTFEGKKVVPFCTFGSGGTASGSNALKAALPKAEIAQGYGVRNARVAACPDELNRFLIEQKYKEGEVEALPAFMEQKPCTKEEVEIFKQACDGYQFPLGTPVTVAGRTTSTGTDYLYTAKTKNEQGEEATSQIYVTVSNAEGAKPEFTEVVR